MIWPKSREGSPGFAPVVGRQRTKIVQLTIQLIVAATLLWLIFRSIKLDSDGFVQAVENASLLLLLSAVLCFSASAILKSLQYCMLFPRSLSGSYIAGLVLSQNALLTFLPWRTGELSVPILLQKDHNVSLMKSASAILIVRFLDFLVVVLVTIIVSRNLPFRIEFANAIYGLGAAMALVGLIYLVWRRFRLQSLFSGFVFTINPIRSPLQFGVLIVLSAGVFVVSTLQSTFTLRAFGLPVLLPEVALLNALTLLAAILPIHPPGGWGTIDSIQIAILQYLHYQPEHSAPVILVAHCFYTLLLVVGGSLGWILRVKSLPR